MNTPLMLSLPEFDINKKYNSENLKVQLIMKD